MLVEELKRSMPGDIRNYLNEREVTTLQDAATKADDYALTHKASLSQNKQMAHVKKNTG